MNCLIPWPPYSSLSCFPASLEFLLERSLKAMRVWVCVCLYHSGFDAGDSGLIPGSSHFLGWEDPLEKGLATRSSILAWRIPWAEEPDGLWSIGSQNVCV